MTKSIYLIFSLAIMSLAAWAGNPDRQGEAGAPELLMNPWARSSGLHTMTTSMITGAEAMRLNVAGVARITKTEIVLGHTQYLRGTDISINGLAFAQRIGKSSALGIELMSLDFGDIPVTTEYQPEGTGSTFSPRFFNIGLGFSHIFENKVSVGVLARAVSESIQDATASTVVMDAGVQYVTGEQDNFKFGISLRNVGGRMQFKGEGLSQEIQYPGFDNESGRTFSSRPSTFEMQSVLNIGMAYDFHFAGNSRITMLGNYTSNAFSEDYIGGGLEFSFKELAMLRVGYKADFGQVAGNSEREPLYSGLAAGFSVSVPVSKKKDAPRIGLDYAYQATKIYDGVHNFSVRINL